MSRRSAIRNASRASDGTVCSTATTPSSTPAARGQRQAAMPSGTPTATASDERAEHQQQVLGASRPKSGANRRPELDSRRRPLPPLAAGAPLAPAATPRAATKRCATSAKLRPSSSTSRVHRDHGRRVDAILRGAAAAPASTRRAHQQHRVVLREEAAVVLEHPQAEPAELGVGGVDVDHVDLARARSRRRPGRGRGRSARRRQRVGLAAAPASRRRARRNSCDRPSLQRAAPAAEQVGDARDAERSAPAASLIASA